MKKPHVNTTWKILFCIFLYIASLEAYAQNTTIRGTVTDADDGTALPGVSVYVKGNSSIGISTDVNGKYTLNVPVNAMLVFSFIGYKVEEFAVNGLSTLDVAITPEGTTLTDVVVIGSRNANRSAIDTPVPVDVLDMQTLNVSAPQINVNQILNYVAPSFTSTTQTVADGTDHIDPASLRGLGPDQVLVLINGKRRHSSSLININGSVGRGNVGTDLNAIPAHSIKRIEVLRDGAAAQYGSDAIAGVINIVLKDQHKGLDLSLTGGGNFSKNGNNFDGGIDGENIQLNANYGIPLGKKGGFINLTGSAYIRNATSRAKGFSGSIYNAYNAIEWEANKDGFDLDMLRTDLDAIKKYAQNVPHFSDQLKQNITAAANLNTLVVGDNMKADVTEAQLQVRGLTRKDFSMKVGQSALRSRKVFLNMAIPLNNQFEVYSFGGISYRKGIAAGFYRRPDQTRANTAAYINGFLPHIHSDIYDRSIAVGIRGEKKEWRIDLSNTWGQNAFFFSVENSSNTTMGKATKTSFYAGGFSFTQNTTNLDVSRFYKDILAGLNVAFGAEYRVENYKLLAGEESSYATYYSDGTVSTNPSDPRTVKDFFGRARPGGAQVFPGYKPNNERDKYRNSVAAYVDVEADISPVVLVSAATRFENYSDFGSTINFKVASRWKIHDNITVRAAGNTGFRAPSLHQLHFNATSTNFINGIPNEVGTFSNDSRIAKLLGIQSLTNETSMSVSGGATYAIPRIGIKITLDGYYIRINNRVTLTGNFSRPSDPEPGKGSLSLAQQELQRLFDQANATKARFFANAIDTESKGVDLVITQTSTFSPLSSLTNNLAISLFATQQIGDIHASGQLANAGLTTTYFGDEDRIFLETAMPRFKGNISQDARIKKWSFFMRNTFFGQVTDPGLDNGKHPVYKGKLLTDLSVGYNFTDNINLVIGTNNLFDIYPDKVVDGLTSGSQFIFPRATSQFGINGRYLFARLNISL